MSTPNTPEEQDAAREAAQNVVDDVTSWEYSGDKDRIEDELDKGFDEAGVDVSQDEKDELASEIDGLKDDESDGAPEVNDADPA